MNVISRFKALMLKDKGRVIRGTANEDMEGSGQHPRGRHPDFDRLRRLGGPQGRC